MEEWYDNKELFGLINQVAKEMNKLQLELVNTKNLIRQYNGLREKQECFEAKIEELTKEITMLKQDRRTKFEIREMVAWGLGILMTLVLLFEKIGG